MTINKKKFYQAVLAAFFTVSFLVPNGYSCPCGCGSSSSISLYPNEKLRFNMGVTNEFLPAYYDNEGKELEGSGAESIHTLTLSLIKRLSRSTTFAGHVPTALNTHKNHSPDTSLGDPRGEVFWTALPRDYSREYLPELVVKAGFKIPVAPSILDKGEHTPVSSHGNGYWEYKAGVDSYFYLQEWMLSASYEQVLRAPRKTAVGTEIDPGMIYKGRIGFAYTFIAKGQLGLSLAREDRARDEVAGVLDDASRMIRHEIGVSTTLRIGSQQSVGFSYQAPAPFLLQQNTPFYKTFGVSFAQTFS